MTAGRPTLDDVAAAAGVSRMTVSNAYNRPDQLSEATRQRVLEAARTLGYAGPDPAARSLRRGRAGAVGVLLTHRLPHAFDDPGLIQFLHGLTTRLSGAGQGLLLVPTLDDDGPSLVRDCLVDAFVLCSLPPDDPAVAAVRARRLPMVTVGSPRLRGVPFVGIDNDRAGREAARHLLGLGHVRVGVVDVAASPGRPHTGMHDRAGGFVHEWATALADRGDVRVVETPTNDREAGRVAARALLEAARGRPTAVFTVTDVLALGVLDEARELGLDVPSRLSVMGFDDVDEAARSQPPLTTVHQRLFEQGSAAAGLALGLVAGETVRAPRLATSLVVRQSTGPARRTHGGGSPGSRR